MARGPASVETAPHATRDAVSQAGDWIARDASADAARIEG